MDYEIGVELVLRAKGRRVMDSSKAKVLMALRDEGEVKKAARALRTEESSLARRIVRLKDEEGRPLARLNRDRVSLTKKGTSVLEIYESRAKFVKEQVEHRYRNPLLTVDGIVPFEGGVVVVRRGREPFRGRLALPGGIVEYGETVEDAVAREVHEETGLRTKAVRLIGLRSRPDRDPRGHFVSAVFLMEVVGGHLRPGDDASAVDIVPLHPLPDLAFDHSEILRDFLEGRVEGRSFPNR